MMQDPPPDVTCGAGAAGITAQFHSVRGSQKRSFLSVHMALSRYARQRAVPTIVLAVARMRTETLHRCQAGSARAAPRPRSARSSRNASSSSGRFNGQVFLQGRPSPCPFQNPNPPLICQLVAQRTAKNRYVPRIKKGMALLEEVEGGADPTAFLTAEENMSDALRLYGQAQKKSETPDKISIRLVSDADNFSKGESAPRPGALLVLDPRAPDAARPAADVP